MSTMAEESHLVQATVTLPRNKRSDGSEQAAEESDPSFPATDPNEPGGITGNLRHLLPLVSICDGQYSTTKRVRYLNDLAKVIKCAGHVIEPNYPVERVIECVRLSLVSGVKEVRAGALRVLRYLLTSKEAFAVMLKHRIDLFVARSLDVPPDREIERLQAMRFVRQAISVSPEAFPRSLASPLVSILLHDAEPQDNLTWSCMATLCELALHNPELASQSGAIRALIRGLLKCSTSRISESVILTLSHILNKPCSRKFIRSQLDVETLLAPITDLHYRHLIDEDKSLHGPDNTQRVEASKMAIVSLLKSWPGIFSLCSPRNSGLGSLLSMLPLAVPDVQKEILDVLYSVFQLKVPVWTESFTDAVTSIDPAQPKNEWSLTEGFVAAEGMDLLPPKTVYRTDLVNCYQALLLATLLETGLFDYLVEVCLKAERHIAVMATILMAQLLHQTNTILPPGYSSDAHTLPDLIASAIDFEEAQDQRHRASEVISCLDRVHQLKKQRVKPSSLYLKLILEQSAYFTVKKKGGETEQQHIHSDLDEAILIALVKDTNVLTTKQYQQWDWKLLFSILQHPSLKSSLLQDDGFSKFIKRLRDFYMPSKHLYSTIAYNEVNARRYSSVGQQLIKYLCRVEDSSSGFLFDLVSDIVAELTQVTASKLTADVFTAANVSHRMCRDYFLFLGTISFHRPSLLLHCKAYGPLLDICNYQNRSDLMRLIISTLDFAHDIFSRIILNKLLTSTDRDMRLYATKHMRVLLRAKMPFFNSWGLELITPQLYDIDRQVAMEAVDILDEGCEEENFLEALVLQQPQLLHLGEKGAALFTRFFSVKRGFTLMSRLGYLEKMLKSWFQEYNLLYVYIVEERLAETLTSFKQTEEGEFIRRRYTSLIFPKAFVPVHFYGQLVQHKEGCTFLEKENHVAKFSETIRAEQSEVCTPSEIQRIKAAVWALGHIGSSPGGLHLLLEEEVIDDLIDLAETCPILSIRGTCFYALCLIAKTPQGANTLLESNWTSVRHSLEEKWPLVFDPNFELSDDITSSDEFSSTKRPFNVHPAPFIQSPFDITSPNRTLTYKSFSGDKFETLPGRVAALGREPVEQAQGEVKFQTAIPSSVLQLKKTGIQHRPLRKTDSTKSEIVQLSEWSRRGAFSSSKKRRFAKDRSSSFVRSEKQTMSRRSQRSPMREMKSPPRPKSLSSADMLDSPADDRGRRFSGTPLRAVSRTISGNRVQSTMPYLGVCLPMDISQMFEYIEPEYQGCVTQVISAPNFNNPDTIPPHDPYHCLECSIPLIKQYHGIGMSISSDSLSSHFLFAPPSSSGGSTPQPLRTRAHTIDSLRSELSTRGSAKVKTHVRSSSTGISLATVHTVAGSQPSSIATTTSKDGQSDSSETGTHTSDSPIPYVAKPQDQSQESSIENGTVNPPAAEPCITNGDERLSSTADSGGRKSSSNSPGDSMSDTRKRLGTGERSSRSSSPLVRMKRILGSVDTDDMKGETERNGVTKGSSGQDVGVAKERAESISQASVKDPEVLIQIIKPSISGAKVSSHVSPSPSTTTEAETSSNSSGTSQSGVVDEASPEGRSRLQHALLEVVYGLSSDVSLKKNTLGLNMICHRFPSVCQDICLYSQVMDILSSYTYNLHTRRFIESKFDKMTFDLLFAAKPQLDEDFSEDDLISSNSSSRRTSYSSLDAMPLQTSLNFGTLAGIERDLDSPVPLSQSRAYRRRSSTSEATRFREKLHSLSQSAEKHEHMMVESPIEDEGTKNSDKMILTTSANANANNNSPGVDGLYYPGNTNGPRRNQEELNDSQEHVPGSKSDANITASSWSHHLRMESRDRNRSSTGSESTNTGSGSYGSGVPSLVDTGYDL